MKFLYSLLILANLVSTMGCANDLQVDPSGEEASIRSRIDYILRTIGEPVLCSSEIADDETRFRMIKWPFRGPMQVVSVRATATVGTLRSTLVNVEDGSAGEVSVDSRFEAEVDSNTIDRLWAKLDSSRVLGQRTSLTDVEDGEYVVFEVTDRGDQCDLVILLSPDSSGVLKLMSYFAGIAEQLSRRRIL